MVILMMMNPFLPPPVDLQNDQFYVTLEEATEAAMANPPNANPTQAPQNELANDPFLGAEHTFPTNHAFYTAGTHFPPNIIPMLWIIDFCDNRKQNSHQFC